LGYTGEDEDIASLAAWLFLGNPFVHFKPYLFYLFIFFAQQGVPEIKEEFLRQRTKGDISV
jgi:hypothetical protein